MFTELRAGDFELKKWGFYGLIFFYAFAGLNHFIMPDFYIGLIPDYFHSKSTYNALAGLGEILVAIGLYFPLSRKTSVFGILFLLLAFIPAHIDFIRVGSCVTDSLCVPEWIAWLRLIVIHPLLIWWALIYRNYRTK